VVQIDGPSGLDHIAAEPDLLSALHGSKEVGVNRVEPGSERGVTACRANRLGQPYAAENHRPIPVGRPAHPFVSPAFVPQQLKELVDRRLLRVDPVGHLTARETLAPASR
jgi:hypothetical protein